MIWYYMIYDMILYDMVWYGMIYDMIYLLSAIGLTPGGSSPVHIYAQRVHRAIYIARTTQLTTEQHNEQQNNTMNNRTTK